MIPSSDNGRPGLLAVSFLVISLALSACAKREGVQTTSTYTFTNAVNADVNFDIYANKDDYDHNQNPLRRLVIPVGKAATIELEAMKTYWVDWYTGDYLLSNWAVDSNNPTSFAATPRPALAVAGQNDQIAISSHTFDVSRSVLLNGNERSSNWRVDIDGVASLNGTHTFVFRRDYTGEYTFTRKTGGATVTPVTFSLFNLNHQVFRMKVMDQDAVQVAEMYFNSDPYSYPHFGRDTLMVNFRQVSYYDYYPARRQ